MKAILPQTLAERRDVPRNTEVQPRSGDVHLSGVIWAGLPV